MASHSTTTDTGPVQESGRILSLDLIRGIAVLGLWRNGLLLVVGFVHSIAWSGDVLMIYAASSLFLIAFRNFSNRALISIGVAVFLSSALCAVWAQHLADTGVSLAGLWAPGELREQDIIAVPWALGYFLRGLGLILVGAGLYRAGFMNGGLPAGTYRKTAVFG